MATQTSIHVTNYRNFLQVHNHEHKYIFPILASDIISITSQQEIKLSTE